MFANVKEVAREERYKGLCGLHNMEYLGVDEFGVRAQLKSFTLFDRYSGKIRHLCKQKSHSLDTEIYLFDFKYYVQAGKTRKVYDQTVFFINSKQLALPEFMMKPEHFGHKLAAYFGWGEDINFESYPAFSETYHLTGEHEEFVRHTFDDKVLKFFSKTSGWTVEAANYYMIFYSLDSLVPVNILNDFYRLGMGIFDLLKEEEM